MRTITLLSIIAVNAGIALASGGAEISTCDLLRPDGLLGKSVTVAGRAIFTMHGTFLTSDPCSDHSQDIVILYPKIEGTPEVSFGLDPRALETLKPFFRPSGGSASACVVLTGQVFYKKRFHSKAEGAGLQGNGFGPRGAFRLAFVLQSVKEAHTCK
jgi:hypothetical protein